LFSHYRRPPARGTLGSVCWRSALRTHRPLTAVGGCRSDAHTQRRHDAADVPMRTAPARLRVRNRRQCAKSSETNWTIWPPSWSACPPRPSTRFAWRIRLCTATTSSWPSRTARRTSASLERMGDLARHIAQQVRIRYPESAIPETFESTFARMGESGEKIAEATQSLLSNPGLSAVPTINAIDEELDELHLSVFAKLAEVPAGSLAPRHIADVTLLSRYYERFGDHAVSVSQKVEYLLTGSWEPDLSKK